MVNINGAHQSSMKTHKFDPALAGALQQQQSASRFDVTVRMVAPLLAPQVAELAALGVQADARRTVYVVDLDREGLAALSDADCVLRISLAQALRPRSAP